MRYLLALPVLLLTACVSGTPVDPAAVMDPRCIYTYHFHATETELQAGILAAPDSITAACFGLRPG